MSWLIKWSRCARDAPKIFMTSEDSFYFWVHGAWVIWLSGSFRGPGAGCVVAIQTRGVGGLDLGKRSEKPSRWQSIWGVYQPSSEVWKGWSKVKFCGLFFREDWQSGSNCLDQTLMQFLRYPLDPLAYFDIYIYGLWNMPNNHDDDDEDEDEDDDDDLPIKNGDIPLRTFKLPKGNVPFASFRWFARFYDHLLVFWWRNSAGKPSINAQLLKLQRLVFRTEALSQQNDAIPQLSITIPKWFVFLISPRMVPTLSAHWRSGSCAWHCGGQKAPKVAHQLQRSHGSRGCGVPHAAWRWEMVGEGLKDKGSPRMMHATKMFGK